MTKSAAKTTARMMSSHHQSGNIMTVIEVCWLQLPVHFKIIQLKQKSVTRDFQQCLSIMADLIISATSALSEQKLHPIDLNQAPLTNSSQSSQLHVAFSMWSKARQKNYWVQQQHIFVGWGRERQYKQTVRKCWVSTYWFCWSIVGCRNGRDGSCSWVLLHHWC